MDFGNKHDEPACECGSEACSPSFNRAFEACRQLGKTINEMVPLTILLHGLDRRETHMMMGMLLGRLAAQGVLNTIDQYGVASANTWLTILLGDLAEVVERETPHQVLITTEVRERE